MSTVWLLLAVSTLIGLVMGWLEFRVWAVARAAPVIVAIAALALREFELWPAVAITLACVTVNQAAYLGALWLRTSAGEQSHDDVDGDR